MEQIKSRKDRKKLNLGVKREFQRWLLMQVLFAVGISAVVAASILYFYARQEIVGSFFDAHVKIRRVSDLLLPVVLAGSCVSLVGGALLALFLPQKIAGPLYRIEEDLRQAGQGDLTVAVRLRTGDTLQDFAATVNTALSETRARVKEVKEAAAEVEKAASAGDAAALKVAIESQKCSLEKIRT